MVEFALAAPMVMLLLFGCVEMSRVLNIYISLNRVCQKAALALAAPDVTSTRPPTVAVQRMRWELRRADDPMRWNPAYGPLTVALGTALARESSVRIDVNEERDDRLFSVVEVRLRLAPLLIPTFQVGNRQLGSFELTGRALAMNETQSPRRDARGRYMPLELPLETLLAHPEDPVTDAPPVDEEGADDVTTFEGFDEPPGGEGDR